MRRHDRWVVSTIIAAGLTASGLSGGASLAAGEGSPPTPKAGAPAKLEQIPGSPLSKVILTPKAAERIALETGTVTEEPVDRWLLVSGEIETITSPPSAAATAQATAPGQGSDTVATIPMLTPGQAPAAATPGPEPSGIVPVRVRVPAWCVAAGRHSRCSYRRRCAARAASCGPCARPRPLASASAVVRRRARARGIDRARGRRSRASRRCSQARATRWQPQLRRRRGGAIHSRARRVVAPVVGRRRESGW